MVIKFYKKKLSISYKVEWEVEVSHAAIETLAIQKYNCPSRIPLAEDLKALSLHVKNEAEIIISKHELPPTVV